MKRSIFQQLMAVSIILVTLQLPFEAAIAATLEDPPMVSAGAWAVSGLSDSIYRARESEQPRQIASLTKIMTALVVLDVVQQHQGLLDRRVMVSARAAAEIGTTAKLETGDRLTIRQLLYAMLLPSGNDAAITLAEYVGRRLGDLPGKDTVERFVAAMNQRARGLGLSGTSFVDVHGMGENVSTPAELIVLTREALGYELFKEITATRELHLSVESITGRSREMTWRNTNELLGSGFRGVKTGHTNAAGGCLVLLGSHAGRSYLVVVLESANERSRFGDAYNLFQWAMLIHELNEARSGS